MHNVTMSVGGGKWDWHQNDMFTCYSFGAVWAVTTQDCQEFRSWNNIQQLRPRESSLFNFNCFRRMYFPEVFGFQVLSFTLSFGIVAFKILSNTTSPLLLWTKTYWAFYHHLLLIYCSVQLVQCIHTICLIICPCSSLINWTSSMISANSESF
jgi:hypothetical protein